MIHVLVVDDHQAVRAGLVALLRQEPGFVPAATATTVGEAVERVTQHALDVTLVDYHLPDATGADLCRRLRGTPPGLLYSAVPSDRMTLAARVAGASGVISKAAPTEELFDAIRAVAKGRTAFPPVRRDALAAATRRLRAEQLPILGMALDGTPPTEMAMALRVDFDEVDAMIAEVLAAVSPSSPQTA
jgi:DNA-binding NarL/FixJ family response regulator